MIRRNLFLLIALLTAALSFGAVSDLYADDVQDAINQAGFGAGPSNTNPNQDLANVADPNAQPSGQTGSSADFTIGLNYGFRFTDGSVSVSGYKYKDEGTAASSGAGSSNTVSGMSPAASDGPVTYQGTPQFPVEKNEETKQFEEDLARAFNGNPFAYSGSRSFGDDIGADTRPEFGYPGDPFGGPPRGSWIHFDRSRAIFSRDQTLINALGTNDFAGLFEGQFGARPVEERFADGMGN